MNITVRQGEIQKTRDEALVVNLFEGSRPAGATGVVDAALDGLLRRVVDSGDFRGERNKTLLLYPGSHGRGKAVFPAARVLVVGLGKREEFDLEGARQAAATAARKLRDLSVSRAATILHGAGAGALAADAAAQALAEGSVLACYRFAGYRTGDETDKELRRLTVVEADRSRVAATRRGIRAGLRVAAGVCGARDLCNEPGNVITPSQLASRARAMARRTGLRCQVLDAAAMRRLGMGALLAVASGTAQAPRFIVLEHGNRRGRRRPLVLVGKGVTFDSGGISLKSGSGMADMKFDMSGAAAVLGALQAVADLDLGQPVVGLIPATENLPDGKALKPGDVVTTMLGKTIEIDNTDAEGRLILADALAYAQRFKPAAIIDLATLTGACVTALGHHASGMMANDDDLAAAVEAAAQATAERVWRLPLWPDYRKQIDSAVADMKNTGGRPGGALTAAALLAEFVADTPWAHLDIAGTAWSSKARPYTPKGGVGWGVRLLVELVHRWQSS